MNEIQTVFALFFAIFFGAIENAMSRWKPFQLPLYFDKGFEPAKHRVHLAFLLFNILPLVFFGITLYTLSGPKLDPEKWSPLTSALIIFRGVIPAFAMLGFYRLWIGIVESRSDRYYAKNQKVLPELYQRPADSPDNVVIEPTIETLGIKPFPGFNMNKRWAIFYFIVASIGPFIALIARLLSKQYMYP